MKIKNLQNGPRGINTDEGQVILNPGEERDLEVAADELKVAKATGWFAFNGRASAQDDDDADNKHHVSQRRVVKD